MKYNIEKSKVQMRRGTLELCVLSMIARNEMYPSDIIDEMDKANLLVVEGTLYPLLTRLKNAGLLTYRWQESPQGPPRKYYSLTEKGQQIRNELVQTWQKLVSSVANINKVTEAMNTANNANNELNPPNPPPIKDPAAENIETEEPQNNPYIDISIKVDEPETEEPNE